MSFCFLISFFIFLTSFFTDFFLIFSLFLANLINTFARFLCSLAIFFSLLITFLSVCLAFTFSKNFLKTPFFGLCSTTLLTFSTLGFLFDFLKIPVKNPENTFFLLFH